MGIVEKMRGGAADKTLSSPFVAAPVPGLRARGVLLAFLLAPIHAAWLVYAEIVLGTATSSASLVPSVLTLIVVITGVNAVVRRVRPSWALSSADLVICYAVLTLSAVLTGFDLLQLLPHSLLLPGYFSNVNHSFTPLDRALPTWFRPTDPAVVASFFEGRADLSDPALWRAWALPVVLWTSFLMVVLLTMLCLNVLVRDQWLHNERLSFPIVALPLTLCDDQARAQLFRSPLFWAAFLSTAVILSVNAVSGLFPSLPGVPLDLNNVGRDFPPPLSGAAPLYLSWTPFGIGLTFFVPADVLFSSWFFFMMRKGLEVTGVIAGWRAANAGNGAGQFPYVREVAQGAWIGLLIVLLWGGRRHLAHVFHAAFPSDGSPSNRTYRFAVLGTLGGIAALTVFEWAAGMRPWLAFAYFILFFLAALVMTRVFAQIASPTLELYFFNAENLLLSFIGTRSLQGPEVALLGQCFWFNHGYRQHPMGQQLAAMKMADQVHLRLRPLAAVLSGAMLMGTVVGLVVILVCYHTFGAATAKVNPAQLGVGGWETWNRAAGWQSAPQGVTFSSISVMTVSCLVCLGMRALGNAWIGSPFQPVGFAFAFSYALDYNWNVFLVVWFLKVLLLRYGGLRIYRQAAPLFLGMALGDAVMRVVWGLIAALFGLKGLSTYLPPRW